MDLVFINPISVVKNNILLYHWN